MVLWWSPQRSNRFVCLSRSSSDMGESPRGPWRLSAIMWAISPRKAASSSGLPGSTSSLLQPGKAQTPPERAISVFISLSGMFRLIRPLRPSEQRPLPRELVLAPVDALVTVPQVDEAEPLEPDGQVRDVDLGFLGQPVKLRPLGQIVALVGFSHQPGRHQQCRLVAV